MQFVYGGLQIHHVKVYVIFGLELLVPRYEFLLRRVERKITVFYVFEFGKIAGRGAVQRGDSFGNFCRSLCSPILYIKQERIAFRNVVLLFRVELRISAFKFRHRVQIHAPKLRDLASVQHGGYFFCPFVQPRGYLRKSALRLRELGVISYFYPLCVGKIFIVFRARRIYRRFIRERNAVGYGGYKHFRVHGGGVIYDRKIFFIRRFIRDGVILVYKIAFLLGKPLPVRFGKFFEHGLHFLIGCVVSRYILHIGLLPV